MTYPAVTKSTTALPGLTRHKRRKHPAPIESSDKADETDEREDEEIEDAE